MEAPHESVVAAAAGRSRRLVPAILLSALVLSLGMFFLVRMFLAEDGIRTGGPLAPPEGSSAAVTAPVDLNAAYSWGLIYLRNQGDETAHVVALDYGRVPAGLRVLGSYAQDPFGRSIGFMPKYEPSNGPPAEGLDIPPDAVYEVVVGLSATAPGRHKIPNVRVRYTSGGTSYEATFHQAVALCAPKADYPKGCPSPL